jgi:selenide,water dikinase
MNDIRLTALAHGGGCGCKISPAILARLMAGIGGRSVPPQLMVGTASSDDAAVYRLNAHMALVATTDFFTPVVDDPEDFGRIAATNALSDIYAMGGTPIFALALVGMPLEKLPVDVIQRILAGGAAVCDEAGIPIAGGHSIDTQEPIYGLAALGLVHPEQLKRNDTAKAGDVLILGKPLGIGILSAALKQGRLSAADYAQMRAVTTQLNRVGSTLGEFAAVHAMTDVTGFGLAGHLLEICRGSALSARLRFADLPLLDAAVALVQAGVATGASGRNWESYGHEIALPADMPLWQRQLLTDPQTSGGLLVAVAPESVASVLAAFHAEGFNAAAPIGTLADAAPAGARLQVV